jgi:hypothetical protein
MPAYSLFISLSIQHLRLYVDIECGGVLGYHVLVYASTHSVSLFDSESRVSYLIVTFSFASSPLLAITLVDCEIARLELEII